MPIWSPEKVVSTKQAKELIDDQFPSLFVEKIEFLDNGWDNTVYLVNDLWVFRFPRRQVAVELLNTETKFLPLVADKLPLAIPKPQYVGKPSPKYEWPFCGYFWHY